MATPVEDLVARAGEIHRPEVLCMARADAAGARALEVMGRTGRRWSTQPGAL